MGHKSEIGWKRRTEDGERVEVFARHVGGEWIFFIRGRRFEEWQPHEQPPLEDWIELYDAVKRRVVRRLLQPDDLDHLARRIRERYPAASLPP